MVKKLNFLKKNLIFENWSVKICRAGLKQDFKEFSSIRIITGEFDPGSE
jgi:hypothetical protein